MYSIASFIDAKLFLRDSTTERIYGSASIAEPSTTSITIKPWILSYTSWEYTVDKA
jgi:hypothetical protein